MIANLQAHYGFTRMPFGAAIPAEALYASTAHKKAVARPLAHLRRRPGRADGRGRLREDGRRPPRRGRAWTPPGTPSSTCPIRRSAYGAFTAPLLPRSARPPFPPRHPHPAGRGCIGRRGRRENRQVLLAIDESHMLTGEQLETVRLLTNHYLDSGSPLTILLIGQPTLKRRLRVGDMAALDQRIQLRYHIPVSALTTAEADGYLRVYLALAAGPTPCSPMTQSALSTPTPVACRVPSTTWPSTPCSPPTPPARSSPTNPPPAPPSPRRPRQTDHHDDTPATETRPAPSPAGFPCRRIATLSLTFVDNLNGREQATAGGS
jgi:hypothetical protein